MWWMSPRQAGLLWTLIGVASWALFVLFALVIRPAFFSPDSPIPILFYFLLTPVAIVATVIGLAKLRGVVSGR